MIYTEEKDEKAQYNQALYQQMRIHELSTRIDRLFVNPLSWNYEFSNHNYQIIFNDLCTLSTYLFPLLRREEEQELDEQIEKIEDFMRNRHIFEKKIDEGLNKHPKIIFLKGNWNFLRKELFLFRVKIEKLMKKHELGNPSKMDPSRVITQT